MSKLLAMLPARRRKDPRPIRERLQERRARALALLEECCPDVPLEQFDDETLQEMVNRLEGLATTLTSESVKAAGRQYSRRIGVRHLPPAGRTPGGGLKLQDRWALLVAIFSVLFSPVLTALYSTYPFLVIGIGIFVLFVLGWWLVRKALPE